MNKTAQRLGSLVLVVILALLGGVAGAWLWGEHKEQEVKRLVEVARAASEAEAKSPRGVQREAVKAALKDPDSAKFQNDGPAPRGKDMWCGEVNARNGMGGMAGFTRYVAEVQADRELAVLDQVIFDVDPGASERQDGRRAEFAGKWHAFCE